MRVATLTGGGDVPGLNPCIKAIAHGAEELGWETLGFRRGWAGPLRLDPDDPSSIEANTVVLDSHTVRVRGGDDAAIRVAIDDAGYDVAGMTAT